MNWVLDLLGSNRTGAPGLRPPPLPADEVKEETATSPAVNVRKDCITPQPIGDAMSTPETPFTNQTAYSASSANSMGSSRHGFYDIDPSSSPEMGPVSHTVSEAPHRHGYLDDGDAVRDWGGTQAGKLSSHPGFWAGESFGPTAFQEEESENIAMESPLLRHQRPFELKIPDFSGIHYHTQQDRTADFKPSDIDDLRLFTRRLKDDCQRLDTRREKDLELDATRRRAMLESTAQNQRDLLRRFQREEAEEEARRSQQAANIASLLNTQRHFTLKEVTDLLATANEGVLPVTGADIYRLEQLLQTSQNLELEVKAVIDTIVEDGQANEADLETMSSMLFGPLGERLLKGGNPIFQEAAELHKTESGKAESARMARQEVELPSLPSLEALKAAAVALNSATKTQKVLRIAGDAAAVLLGQPDTLGVALTAKQRGQLWRVTIGALVQSAADGGIEAVHKHAILLFSCCHIIETEGGSSVAMRVRKMVRDTLGHVCAVMQPQTEVTETAIGNTSQVEALAAVFSRLASLEGGPISEEDALTWFVKSVQCLERALTKYSTADSGEIKGLLQRYSCDCMIALASFLKSGGGSILARQFKSIFRAENGVLAALKETLSSAKQLLPAGHATSSTVLAELIELTSKNSLPEAHDCENVDVLRALLLSQRSDKRRAVALHVMAEKEFELTAPILKEALGALQMSAPLEAVLKVADAFIALVNLLKSCGVTLSPSQRSFLGFEKESSQIGVLQNVSKMLHQTNSMASAEDANAVTLATSTLTDLIDKGFVDAAETNRDRYTRVVRLLALLTEKVRQVGLHVLGRQELASQLEMDSIPYKLNTVSGMLSKTTCVRLINSLVDRILSEKPHMLLFALATIAKEIADKCSSEQFSYRIAVNPTNIASIIHGTIASTKSEDFVIFVKAELASRCPFVVPHMSLPEGADSASLSNGHKGALTVYAICCVQEGGLATAEDAWRWVANAVNWCKKQGAAASGKPVLEMYVVDLLNLFLRITSERLSSLYGAAYQRLLQAILTLLPPMLKRNLDSSGRPVDDKLSEFLREALKGRFLSVFNKT